LGGRQQPFYRIYSADTSDGPLTTLEGSTSATTFTIHDVSAMKKFYVVGGGTVP
jgi:hypothetical protein